MADIDPGGSAVGTVLRMRLFGPASFAIGGRELRFKSLKLRAALGYIALSELQTETRERLVGMLWSESGEDHARASLRQNIRELRVALEGIELRRALYRRSRNWFRARHGRARRPDGDRSGRSGAGPSAAAGTAQIWRMSCWPGWRTSILRFARGCSRNAIRSATVCCAHWKTPWRTESRDLTTQGKLAQAILNLDPTHEDAARRLMRARAMLGDTAGALRVYKTLWDLLDEDYGMEPAEATQKLVADIKTGLFERATPSGARTACRRAGSPLQAGRGAGNPVVAVGPDSLHPRS